MNKIAASMQMPPNEQMTQWPNETVDVPNEDENCWFLLAEIVRAFDTGNLQMNSPEIQAGTLDENGDAHPPHPWHEEWLASARALIAPRS